MKIGEFAKKYQVSRDTVRFYIKKGLLVPNDQAMQLQFDEQDCRDMEVIQQMKAQRFSLSEIHRYLDILRVSTMLEPESIQAALDILDIKRIELSEEIERLQKICSGIEEQAKQLASHEGNGEMTGVPLAGLAFLVCPHCGGNFSLEQASLNSRYVFSGILKCSCGYEAKIEDGIVKTGNLYTEQYDSPDLKRGLYRDVSENFVTYMKKCTDFVRNEIQSMNLWHKVVLEGHVNGYFFLYNNIQLLERDCLYIVTDKFPEILEMYKKNIDRLNLGLDILYLADASMKWPLRKHCADVLVNFFGDTEHSLYFKESYLNDVKPFLRENAVILGAALGYLNRSKSMQNLKKKYPEGDLAGFYWEKAEQSYEDAGYRLQRQDVGFLLYSYDQYAFSCHESGEKMMIGAFRAEAKI